MLGKLGEWYRIVTPNPRHEDLEKRKTSVESLVSTLKAKSKPLIPEPVAGLAWHFDANMAVVATLIDAIRAQDLSFPTDIEMNELELKVVAALALGEIMNRSRSSKARRLAATFMISAFGIPRDIHSQTQHFAEMLKSLHNVAADVVDQDAEAIRQVPSLSLQSIDISQRFHEMDDAARSSSAPNQHVQLWLALRPSWQKTIYFLLPVRGSVEPGEIYGSSGRRPSRGNPPFRKMPDGNSRAIHSEFHPPDPKSFDSRPDAAEHHYSFGMNIQCRIVSPVP